MFLLWTRQVLETHAEKGLGLISKEHTIQLAANNLTIMQHGTYVNVLRKAWKIFVLQVRVVIEGCPKKVTFELSLKK